MATTPKLSQTNWLYIFVGLLGFAILNCSATYYLTLPPKEGTPFIYWPRILFARSPLFSILLSILLLILCLIATIGITIKRRNWTAFFTIILTIYMGLLLFGFSFSIDDPSYTHLQSLQVDKQTYQGNRVLKLMRYAGSSKMK